MSKAEQSLIVSASLTLDTIAVLYDRNYGWVSRVFPTEAPDRDVYICPRVHNFIGAFLHQSGKVKEAKNGVVYVSDRELIEFDSSEQYHDARVIGVPFDSDYFEGFQSKLFSALDTFVVQYGEHGSTIGCRYVRCVEEDSPDWDAKTKEVMLLKNVDGSEREVAFYYGQDIEMRKFLLEELKSRLGGDFKFEWQYKLNLNPPNNFDDRF